MIIDSRWEMSEKRGDFGAKTFPSHIRTIAPFRSVQLTPMFFAGVCDQKEEVGTAY